MRGPGDDDHAQSGDELAWPRGSASITRRSRWAPTPEPPTVTMQTCSSGRVAQLGAQRVAVGELGGVEAGDVAGEVVVLLGPVADRREAGAERVGDDVVGLADEDRPVADARVARDVLDHLGVVVGGEERLVLAAVGHRQPADEVGEPRVRGASSAPGSRAGSSRAPRPRRRSTGRSGSSRTTSWKTMKLASEDLVHPPPRLEAVQVVLGRLGLDVRRLVGELGAGRMDALAARLEHAR